MMKKHFSLSRRESAKQSSLTQRLTIRAIGQIALAIKRVILASEFKSKVTMVNLISERRVNHSYIRLKVWLREENQ